MPQTQEKKLRKIPKNTYDALELSVLAAGGIGGGECSVVTIAFDADGNALDEVVIPVCLLGHINFLTGEASLEEYVPKLPATKTMIRHVGGRLDEDGHEQNVTEPNDMVFDSVPSHGPISWKSYCKLRGWVRGD